MAGTISGFLKHDYLKGYAIYVLRYCCYVLKISPISNPTVRARASIFFQYRVVGSTLAFRSENSPGYLQESSTSRKDLQDTPIQPHSSVRAVSSEVLLPECSSTGAILPPERRSTKSSPHHRQRRKIRITV
jgi:hypothetical protein